MNLRIAYTFNGEKFVFSEILEQRVAERLGGFPRKALSYAYAGEAGTLLVLSSEDVCNLVTSGAAEDVQELEGEPIPCGCGCGA